MSARRILVVGAGTIGTAILHSIAGRKELSAAALVRPASLKDSARKAKLDRLTALGVALIEGDVTDEPDVLAGKLRGFHTVVCAAERRAHSR